MVTYHKKCNKAQFKGIKYKFGESISLKKSGKITLEKKNNPLQTLHENICLQNLYSDNN